GRRLNADEALSVGLITRVVAADRLQEEARDLARALLDVSWVSLAAMKRCVNRGIEMDLASGLNFENEQMAYL
ncbi:enoyl-CoA hydratase-related protein, partial [Nitrospinae bacterium AH-259-F20]|nr:enoyl-CoA hydratase-related protein [Nitrospinae bacterium AH-259-F20]